MPELARRGGRPRRSSADVLADAAAELFLEQGYEGTTVDDIAARAGVSRATFFNYFAAKADVMWVELDAALAGVPRVLADSHESSAPNAVAGALLTAARGYDPLRVPWALVQAEIMGIGRVLVESGAVRLLRLQRTVASFVAERSGDPIMSLKPQAIAGAVVGASASAFRVWALDGTSRRPLDEYVQSALAPLVRGFTAAGWS